MRILDACLLCILCVEANCYDYYDYLPEPVPLTVHDLPPGHLEDIDGEDVHVQTPLGDVLGRRRIEKIDLDAETNVVDWYLGIPYAEPPVGENRFKAPVEKLPWHETLRAVRQKWVCPQAPLYRYTDPSLQSEDCLFLNIFVPYRSTEANRTYPVMVYIHGGSYEYGGNAVYMGHLLAQHGVIVVSINYRLGLLGFLTARSEHLSGNYGLMDQIEALKWVKNNIVSFHGDPHSVTIFGNSAGGSSVVLLTLSPLTSGLFQKAIAQSGAPLSFWAMHNKTVNLRQHAGALMNLFGCNQHQMQDKVACMRKVPWQKFMSYDKRKVPNISPSEADFKPCVDNHVIHDVPRVLLQQGRIHPVTMMIGTVKDEWTRNIGWFIQELYSEVPHLDEQFGDGIDRGTFERAIDHVITRRFGWSQTVADVVKDKYTDWTKTYDPIENRNQYVHFFTDLSMIAPTVATASYMHRHHIPVYMYTFNHHSLHANEGWWGSYHSIELNYIFGSPFTGFSVDTGTQEDFSESDKEISTRMMVLWTNFAKYGDPTPTNFHETYRWKYFQSSTSDYLYIAANDTSMRTHLRSYTMSFWNELVQNLVIRDQQNAAVPVRTYRMEMWLFVGISITLLCLLLLSLATVMRIVKGSRYGFVNNTETYNGDPVKV